MLVLLLVRPQVLEIPYRAFFTDFWSFYTVVLAAYYDQLLAIGLGTVFVGLAFVLRKQPRAQLFVLGAFIGMALVSVWVGVSYVTTSKLVGGPITYAWLYYSDFLQNSDAKAALSANITWELAAEMLAWTGLFLLLRYLLYPLMLQLETRRWGVSAALALSVGGALTYFAAGPRLMTKHQLLARVVANPVVTFSQSFYRSLGTPADLFATPVPQGFEAFPTPQAVSQKASGAPSNSRIRNVVLFVLESVPAEYTAGYQTRHGVMPNLERYLSQSLRVTDMYAHLPSTNNAAVALLGSLYPMISYESISKEHPDIRVPSLSSEMSRYGYRTGFFFAADTRFQNMNGFLANRNFETVADFQTISCTKPVLRVSKNEEDWLSSTDESCMVNACMQWLPANDKGAPFFATLWTAQTHYPYFPVGSEIDYGVRERYLNHYLNALHYSDLQLGKLLDELKRRGLAESTLVVVVGDHGEAFGRHAQYGHASNIYEENVRIPLFLINPLLFHGEKLQAVGGQVDVAPSIFDILRLPVPNEWQGTSLFNPARLNRAYFFSPYSQYSFGYRTPQHKVIFNAYSSKTEVFDLQKDPHETTNLADQMPDFVQESHMRLASWVQYQNAFISRLLASEPAPPVPVAHHPNAEPTPNPAPIKSRQAPVGAAAPEAVMAP